MVALSLPDSRLGACRCGYLFLHGRRGGLVARWGVHANPLSSCLICPGQRSNWVICMCIVANGVCACARALLHTVHTARTPSHPTALPCRLGEHMAEDVLLVVAEEVEGGRMVAAALNLIGSHCLYGRNWGCMADKEFKHLHFELCYYQVCVLAREAG